MIVLKLWLIACMFLLGGCATVQIDEPSDTDTKAPFTMQTNADGNIVMSVDNFAHLQMLLLYEKAQIDIGASWKQKYEDAANCVAENDRMHFGSRQCFEKL